MNLYLHVDRLAVFISEDAHKIHSSMEHKRGNCGAHANEFKSKYISDEKLLSSVSASANFWHILNQSIATFCGN